MALAFGGEICLDLLGIGLKVSNFAAQTAVVLCSTPAFSSRVTICCQRRNSVVVTRERGKNDKLIKALRNHQIECLELPLIEHTPGPDLHRLALTLQERSFQWIVVTSPEAAAVFANEWKNAGCPKVKVAVVGDGTKQAFRDTVSQPNFEVGFVSSQATAKVLAEELPKPDGGQSLEVLYPASLKASDDLANGLSHRGFKVCRLNTYSTESVKVLPESDVQMALRASVVAFASPTAVKAWMELVAKTHDWNGAAACIGGTSAAAARKAGMEKIFYAHNPGIDGWVESVLEALKNVSAVAT
ncbi:hypothetical protein SELMODRAFT_422651 [Selaginella moellendorffii]|uniref:Uroporphyrinogen-III synthase n=1 Tax=Selaginella moellendorffii TaxID=88036 RepID=D8SJ37_SELML|nr:hypothetical protein SELMODRAFT_422651 [Selaginella moellendorffii]